MIRSLLESFARIFYTPPRTRQSDSDALASDWDAVGKDLYRAIQIVEDENELDKKGSTRCESK